jgi:RHS repeat-associated protein
MICSPRLAASRSPGPPASGFVTQATAGLVTEAWTYNDYGEVETYTATVGGVFQIAWSYVRDDLGRIVEKTETTPAGSRVLVYEHDLAGSARSAVYEDGLLAESYGYDDNGNRFSSLNADGVFDAAFDDQDRLLEYGDDAFTWTDNGELYSKDRHRHAGTPRPLRMTPWGNLRGVGLPERRSRGVPRRRPRPARSASGSTACSSAGGSGAGKLQPVAELDGAGNVVARFVHAGGVNVPALMVTPTATYRLVTDHLGSVRRVLDIATGAVLQELEYDAWGRVLLDTNPGLQPFGFAGGLYDPDTGLVRFGARDYDAETGRWTAKDPVRFGGGVNLYEYAASDPSNMRDPSGRDPELGEEGGWEGPAGPPEGFDPEGGDESLSELEGGTSFLDRLTDWFFAIVAGPTGCAEKERTYKQHIEICNKKLSDCMGRSNILSPRQCEICYDICRGRQEAPNGKEWPEYDHNGYSCDYRKKSGSR